MSFDIRQLHLADNSLEAQVVEAIINRDHVSPEEAVRTAIRGASVPLATSSPRSKEITDKPSPLTAEEIRQLSGMGKTFGLLSDVPDERIDQIAETIAQIKSERFP